MSKRRDEHREKIEALLRGFSERPLVEPPGGVLRRAKALGRRLPASPPTLIEQIAALVFDSGAQPELAGVRSGEAGERRLLYRAGEEEPACEIDLRLRRAGAKSIEIMGQVLPPAGGRAAIICGERRREAALGEDGDFVFRQFGTGAGAPRLELELEEGGRIVVEALPLPEGP